MGAMKIFFTKRKKKLKKSLDIYFGPTNIVKELAGRQTPYE